MHTKTARPRTHTQWIHTDVERCKAESPYKNTIAHGFLTLSLAPKFMYQLVEVGQVKMLLNYGTNKVGMPVLFTLFSRVLCQARGLYTVVSTAQQI